MISSEPSLANFVLGTAQLGMPYGAVNRSGQPSQDETHQMLDLALRRGVRTFDTAQGYGDSEKRIGRWLAGRSAPRIVTKLAPGLDPSNVAAVRGAVSGSREQIGPALEGVLLHDPSRLDGWLASAHACVDEGLVEFAGVSVYEPDDFAKALTHRELTAIQAPFSVADRRLEERGLLREAQDRGVRLFLRSAFLQGLLVAEPAALPARFGFLAPALTRWRDACRQLGLRPQAAALAWVKARAPKAAIVVGAETVNQLADTLDTWERASLDEASCDILATALGALPSPALDPRRWPTR